jgi:hypothetical protein
MIITFWSLIILSVAGIIEMITDMVIDDSVLYRWVNRP